MDAKTEYLSQTQKLLEKQHEQARVKKAQACTARMRAEEFRRVLRSYDKEQQRLNEEKERRRKIEDKQRQEKREREKRINEIRGLLAHYRRKLAFNKNDPEVLAAISELEHKLFWLMFGL